MTLGTFVSKTILLAQQHRPTHWFYSNHPEHFFDGMTCLGKHDANQLEERIKAHNIKRSRTSHDQVKR